MGAVRILNIPAEGLEHDAIVVAQQDDLASESSTSRLRDWNSYSRGSPGMPVGVRILNIPAEGLELNQVGIHGPHIRRQNPQHPG